MTDNRLTMTDDGLMTADNERKIRAMAGRFLEGETSLEEERQLTDLCRHAQLPPDLLPLREMLLALESVGCGTDNMDVRADERQTAGATPVAKSRNLFTKNRKWLAAAAAVVVLLAGGGTLLWHQQQNQCVAYIYGKRCTDQAVIMKEVDHQISEVSETDIGVEEQLNDMFGIN